jgi:arylsulfatase A-like enzyme
VLKRLPNIRKLFITQGLTFTRMYNEDPLCCPARANFLTGQHTLTNRVVRNDGDLLNPRRTIALALQGSGYHTMMVGKYLNRYDGPTHPVGWDQIVMQYRNADRVINLATQWLKAAPADRPVFAWLSSTAPHHAKRSFHPSVPLRDRGAEECRGIRPFKPPSYRLRPRSGFPRTMPAWPRGWKLVPICEALLSVDRLVESVVAAQDTRGRPAYFLFMSDNGMAWGQKGTAGKGVPEATRLPFHVSGPGIARGTSTGALHSIIDIAPTLAAIADVPLPWADGTSFLPLLKGATAAGRKKMLEIYPISRHPWAALRLPGWRYIRWRSGRRELYDLQRDPWELRNLAGARRAKTRELDRQLTSAVNRSRP